MERTAFLKFIQQKNDNSDARKLSLQNLSSSNNERLQKGIFNVESSPFHSQLPAFMNRKVKNLKPYTNHFKRFNIQTSKIEDSPQKTNNGSKINGGFQNSKAQTAKKNLLKQLGIGQEIKPTQTGQKIPQISVYEQFLQKTSTMFTSNIIESLCQNSFKRDTKILKQTYQRSHRQTNPDSEQKNVVQKQQRQSLGMNPTQSSESEFAKKNSKKSIRSMNQLPKTEDAFLKGDRVCVVPNLINLQHEDFLCKSEKKNLSTLKKKYTVQLNGPSKKVSEVLNSGIDKSQSIFPLKKLEVMPSYDQVLISLPKNEPIIEGQDEFSHDLDKAMKVKFKNDFTIKNSPKKQQFITGAFNFNIGIRPNEAPKTPFGKHGKEDTTINADKSKNKISTPEVALPSNVTAFSFIVYEPVFSRNPKLKQNEDNLRNNNKIFGNNRVLGSVNSKSVVQIASLTKIMTFLLALEICQKLKIDSTLEKIRIGKFQANINGTSAEIQEGQIYTLQHLFYGLMLPSGNDASLALAIWGGKKLMIHQLKQKQKQKRKTSSDSFQLKNLSENEDNEGILKFDQKKIVLKKRKCYQRFILQMNKKARYLGMSKTTYANSHGLSNNLNKSCAFDLCILCEYAMTIEKFKQVVSTIDYKCKIQYEDIVKEKYQSKERHHIKVEEYENDCSDNLLDDVQHENQHSDEESTQSIEQKDQLSHYLSTQRLKNFSISQTNFTAKESEGTKPLPTYGERQISWQNTHKLLHKQDYIGIKTGITNTAGPCLASCIKTKENRYFIIIVLNSKKLNYRFKDTETLRKWIYKKEKIVLEKKKQKSNNENETGQNAPEDKEDETQTDNLNGKCKQCKIEEEADDQT